jgi:hypothetical protein
MSAKLSGPVRQLRQESRGKLSPLRADEERIYSRSLRDLNRNLLTWCPRQLPGRHSLAMTLVTPIAAHKMPDCEGADGRSLIDRSRALNDCLRLHDLITGKIEAACKGVSDNLGLLFSAHMESGRLRNGTILRDGIDAMARLAGQLIDDILDESDPQPKTPDAVQKIREHVVRFLEFLDTEVDRFAKRVEVELECANGHNGIIAPARNLWSEPPRDCRRP